MQIIRPKPQINLTSGELRLLVHEWAVAQRLLEPHETSFDLLVDGAAVEADGGATGHAVWQVVPSDWGEERCPDSAIHPASMIEVEYRNGKTAWIAAGRGWEWVQEDHPYDIVRYRAVSQ